MVDRVGPLAMIPCKPRQARKGAAVAGDSCAEVWLAWFAANSLFPSIRHFDSSCNLFRHSECAV